MTAERGGRAARVLERISASADLADATGQLPGVTLMAAWFHALLLVRVDPGLAQEVGDLLEALYRTHPSAPDPQQLIDWLTDP